VSTSACSSAAAAAGAAPRRRGRPALRRRPPGLLRDRRGASALEFALVGGTLMVMILAATDLGRYYLTMHALRTAAADAARAAIVSPLEPDCGSTAVQTRARQGILGSGFALSVQCAPDGPGMTRVTVTATRPFGFVMRAFGLGQMTLREQASFRFAS
jgi:hypothetical protein